MWEHLPLRSHRCIFYVLAACSVEPHTDLKKRRWIEAAAAARAQKLLIPERLRYPHLTLTPSLSMNERSLAMYFYMYPRQRSNQSDAIALVRGLQCIHPFPLSDVSLAVHEHLCMLPNTGTRRGVYLELIRLFVEHLATTKFEVDWLDAIPMCPNTTCSVTSAVFGKLHDWQLVSAVLTLFVHAPCSFVEIVSAFPKLFERTTDFTAHICNLSPSITRSLQTLCLSFLEKHQIRPCTTCVSQQYLHKTITTIATCDCAELQSKQCLCMLVALDVCRRLLETMRCIDLK